MGFAYEQQLFYSFTADLSIKEQLSETGRESCVTFLLFCDSLVNESMRVYVYRDLNWIFKFYDLTFFEGALSRWMPPTSQCVSDSFPALLHHNMQLERDRAQERNSMIEKAPEQSRGSEIEQLCSCQASRSCSTSQLTPDRQSQLKDENNPQGEGVYQHSTSGVRGFLPV